MNTQQVVHPRPANGYGRQRVDRDMGGRTESKMHSRKPAFSNVANAGLALGGPSRDRAIYVMSYLRGQHVEVYAKNGSIIAGIFYGTDADKTFGILLKMARIIKDGSNRVQKSAPDTSKKFQTMIIPAKDIVQVLSKDMSLTIDDFLNAQARESRKDLMVDSAISHSHHVDKERELKPWTPDKDYPDCSELEHTFDGPWNRNWDQFETNKTLFGVKSTFDEELYTTKLERGPHMREIEREAMRIAREIEGEETRDRHLAEERGIWLNEDIDLDDESRYSAVPRDVDGDGYENLDDSFADAGNTETFGDSLIGSFSDTQWGEDTDEAQPSSTYSPVDGETSNQFHPEKNTHISGSADYVSHPTSDYVLKSLSKDNEIRLDEKQIKDLGDIKNQLDNNTDKVALGEAQTSKSETVESSAIRRGLSPSATAYESKISSLESTESAGPSSVGAADALASSTANELVNPSLRPACSTPSPSASPGAASTTSGPGLSPSSSVGSLSAEKSTLNPHAKEFKFNPNAQSFSPAPSIRTQTPTPEGSFYYSSNIPVAPHFGPTYGGPQPVYNQQGPPLLPPQAYMPPGAPPLYAQQMMLAQPRAVYYMPPPYLPGYPPERPNQGRNY